MKLRQRVTKGAGSCAVGVAMAFKHLLLMERSGRRLDAHERIPLVRAGVKFENGDRKEHENAKPIEPMRKATRKNVHQRDAA